MPEYRCYLGGVEHDHDSQNRTVKVVRFPPLPQRPPAPRLDPDPRQRQFREIVETLAEATAESGRLGVSNTTGGFPASALNLGQLQEALQAGVATLDMQQVHERWKDDLFDWMRLTIGAWVQRCKFLRMRLRKTGIHIEIETQDDYGYYCYEFDVFPGGRGV